MGTKGYIVIKFNNRYYKIYNHFDSYPSNLGVIVIDFIKKLKENGELEQSEECFNTIMDFCKKIDNEKVNEGDAELDVFIQWIYKIDMDLMLLIIKNYRINKVYNIHYISDNWLDEFISILNN